MTNYMEKGVCYGYCRHCVSQSLPMQSVTASWKPSWWHLYWESAEKLASPRGDGVMDKWRLVCSVVPQGSISTIKHLC